VDTPKVAINTAAIQRPALVQEAARCFGSSTIVVSIEAGGRPDGSYEAFTENGRQETGIDAVAWAARVVELGAGELIITSIEREGTGKGFELALIRRVADAVGVPVIACGGAGSPDDVRDVILKAHADAVSLASILHYTAVRRLPPDAAAEEGNTTFLSSPPVLGRIQDSDLLTIKRRLAEAGIESRPAEEAMTND
jgi:cyclase